MRVEGSHMKIHEGVLNRYVTCNDWTVYLDEGMPIGFEHATLGDEGAAVCGLTASFWLTMTASLNCPRASQTSKLGFNMSYVEGIDVF